MLARMAKSMGCALRADPGNWYIARSRGVPLTAEYYSPSELLDAVLNYYEAFYLDCRVVDNPFYGMSLEEAELRLAVMGA